MIQFASLAIKDPKLKILVAELDFVGAAIPANATAWTARRRIDQLLELEDDRLRAVASLANTMKQHVDVRKQLVQERESILKSVRSRQ